MSARTCRTQTCGDTRRADCWLAREESCCTFDHTRSRIHVLERLVLQVVGGNSPQRVRVRCGDTAVHGKVEREVVRTRIVDLEPNRSDNELATVDGQRLWKEETGLPVKGKWCTSATTGVDLLPVGAGRCVVSFSDVE